VSDQYVAEIRIFGFNFAPTGWALCNGQILPVSQNTALFSLLSTAYGGDGKSTFALPDLQGSAPMQQGQGPGLDLYDLGQNGGSETVTLINSEMPAHSHGLQANVNPANLAAPNTLRSLARSSPGTAYNSAAASPVGMSPQAVGVTGGSQPHNNMQPYLTLNFCIALQGIFPPRS
jgi:microcystin-dependent protein